MQPMEEARESDCSLLSSKCFVISLTLYCGPVRCTRTTEFLLLAVIFMGKDPSMQPKEEARGSGLFVCLLHVMFFFREIYRMTQPKEVQREDCVLLLAVIIYG